MAHSDLHQEIYTDKPERDAPEVARNKALSGLIVLDGRQFEGCRFENAVLVYSGGAPPQISGCSFRNTQFRFEGAAGRSLAFLQAMAAPSSGLRDIFKASFSKLFGH